MLSSPLKLTVTYDQSAEYKRMTGYDATTGIASWEISVQLDKDHAKILDQTYSGNDPIKAVHYVIKDSIKIFDENGNEVSGTSWSFNSEYEQEKDGELVRFSIEFAKAGYYNIQYETKLFESVLTDTKIYNYVSVKDDENYNISGSGTVQPVKNIGVEKTAGSKDYDSKTVSWNIKANTEKQTVSNMVIKDVYNLIAGTNQSVLSLIKSSLSVTASDSETPLMEGTDYIVTLLRDDVTFTDGTTEEIETEFEIKLIGDNYETTFATIDVKYGTSVDFTKQVSMVVQVRVCQIQCM